MIIQILGTGCPKCKQLAENARLAVTEAGVECEIVKVTQIDDIMAMGVMMTPGLAIDGEVKSMGKLLAPAAIKELIEAAGEKG